jgi:hypothetical protein
MSKDDAIKLALEAFKDLEKHRCLHYPNIVKALEEALTQEQDEPVTWESVLGAVARGWCYEENANKTMDSELAVAIAKEVHALCTTPQQRTWVGLTLEERDHLWEVSRAGLPRYNTFAGLVESKLKEKYEN